MTDSEKDRLGDKLHKKEKAEEDRYFAERDKGLLEKLRHEKADERCPACGTALVAVATEPAVAVPPGSALFAMALPAAAPPPASLTTVPDIPVTYDR